MKSIPEILEDLHTNLILILDSTYQGKVSSLTEAPKGWFSEIHNEGNKAIDNLHLLEEFLDNHLPKE